MIEVSNLSKEFKINKKYEGLTGAVKSFFSHDYTIKKAVDGIDFKIDKGDMVGYIGLNGAGKSTTIKILTGLMVPTSGKCVVNGMVPYESRKEYTKDIGVVFGNRTQLWWDLPVSESFTVLKKIYKIPDEKYKKKLDFLKEVLEINEFYLTPVRNLSLGQKMRADLIASLLHSPKVLFLDEPTIGLDILVKDKIRKALREINKETDTTVLLTTHDLDDIEEICNKIIVIDKGKKIFDGELGQLKKTYGKERKIIVDIKENIKVDFNKIENIDKKFISQTRDEKGKLVISINSEHINLPNVMNYMFNNYEIKDFTVLEPQLESIVKKIYEK
ncbi:ATP-binding cassette domain-containing protein [uncultured Clostridium sp.]|uniref:ABC transporter ATP-binding protein n=1 Tax=uncultured Clostridium sp. TaxID=59620 RepID=UPI0025CEE6FA|nr:ATP-binding cassette domain-containing protein [uncultured Clostridium sp.]